MCGVCRIQGQNNHFKNGSTYAETITFYSECTEEGSPLELFVCRLHSIELFKIGERRFLDKYKALKTGFKKVLYERNQNFINIFESPDDPKPIRIEISVN